MGKADAGLPRPSWLRRLAQEHARVFFFSLGKIGRAPLATALSALVIGIALALPAALQVVAQNFTQVGHSWQESLQISLFLKDSASPERGEALTRELRAQRGVAETRYISKDQSLEEFSTQAGFGDALTILGDNPLPAVIVVTPTAQLGKAGVADLAARFGGLPEVDVAKLDQKWLERLHALLSITERAASIIAVLLGIAVLVIVGNTIRLDIEARREEIEVMKLLGAPTSFIRRPFLYAGVWHGLFGGLLAWMLVLAGIGSLSGPAATLAQAYGSGFVLQTLPVADGLGLVAAGVGLGWLAAWLTVARRLGQVELR